MLLDESLLYNDSGVKLMMTHGQAFFSTFKRQVKLTAMYMKFLLIMFYYSLYSIFYILHGLLLTNKCNISALQTILFEFLHLCACHNSTHSKCSTQCNHLYRDSERYARIFGFQQVLFTLCVSYIIGSLYFIFSTEMKEKIIQHNYVTRS